MRIVSFALLMTVSVLVGAATADPLPKRVLIVLTNTAQVPGSDRPTGVWASDYTDPYQVFSKAGFEVHVASPRGGKSLLTVADALDDGCWPGSSTIGFLRERTNQVRNRSSSIALCNARPWAASSSRTSKVRLMMSATRGSWSA